MFEKIQHHPLSILLFVKIPKLSLSLSPLAELSLSHPRRTRASPCRTSVGHQQRPPSTSILLRNPSRISGPGHEPYTSVGNLTCAHRSEKRRTDGRSGRGSRLVLLSAALGVAEFCARRTTVGGLHAEVLGLSRSRWRWRVVLALGGGESEMREDCGAGLVAVEETEDDGGRDLVGFRARGWRRWIYSKVALAETVVGDCAGVSELPLSSHPDRDVSVPNDAIGGSHPEVGKSIYMVSDGTGGERESSKQRERGRVQ